MKGEGTHLLEFGFNWDHNARVENWRNRKSPGLYFYIPFPNSLSMTVIYPTCKGHLIRVIESLSPIGQFMGCGPSSLGITYEVKGPLVSPNII